MGALQPTALTDQEKVSLMVTIEAFVTALARTTNAAAQAEAQSGTDHEAFWRAPEPALVAAMESVS